MSFRSNATVEHSNEVENKGNKQNTLLAFVSHKVYCISTAIVWKKKQDSNLMKLCLNANNNLL